MVERSRVERQARKGKGIIGEEGGAFVGTSEVRSFCFCVFFVFVELS